MHLTNTHKILIGAITLVVLFGLCMMFTKKVDAPAQINNTGATSTSQKIPGTNLSIEGNGNYTITQVPTGNVKTIAVPDLNRPVIFGSTVTISDEVKKILTDKIRLLQASLKNNSKNIAN